MGWKRKQAEKAGDIAQQQFDYQTKLIDQREAQRNAAMEQMNYLMNNQPTYQIPAQVQQYTDLMNTLGAQLYGLQDASGGQKSIDPNAYRSQTTQVDPWKSGAPPYNPVIPGQGGTSDKPTGTHRQPGDVSPTTQGRPYQGGDNTAAVDQIIRQMSTGSGRRK